jgi:DNA-binding MarR family transcriptional regulator
VIEQSTAQALADVLRELVRGSRAAVPALGRDGLPSSMAGVIGVLASEGEARLSRLAEALGVDLSVASRHAAAAQDRGLVERRPHPRDGRACLFHLTDAGREALTTHRGARTAWLQEVAGSWTDEEVQRLVTDLARLRDDVRATPSAGRTTAALTPAG